MSKDMQVVLGLTAVAVCATGLLGALVLQAVRRRSLLMSIIVAALAPVASGPVSLIWPHRDGLIWPHLRHAGDLL